MCRRPAFLNEECPTELSAATAIEGAGETLTVATFGVSVEACMEGNNFNGLAFGDPAEPTVFIYGWTGEYRCGPETWIGAHVTKAYRVGEQPDPIELMVTLTIEGFAGDWDNEAPQERRGSSVKSPATSSGPSRRSAASCSTGTSRTAAEPDLLVSTLEKIDPAPRRAA